MKPDSKRSLQLADRTMLRRMRRDSHHWQDLLADKDTRQETLQRFHGYAYQWY